MTTLRLSLNAAAIVTLLSAFCLRPDTQASPQDLPGNTREDTARDTATAGDQYVPVVGEVVPQQPYRRYSTLDKFDRRIDFYLSEEPDAAPPLPLVVYVHGSGAQSHFAQIEGSVRGATGHNTIADVVRRRARLLIVEKPGVAYLDAPASFGGAVDATPTFRAEHTLDRWAEAVQAAIKASLTLDEIRPGLILVIGHSEGGIVAAKVAADFEAVTHVAVLAGEGPTQLFSLLRIARDGGFFSSISADPNTRAQYLLDQWAQVMADPLNADSLFFGHPYLRWSSFLSTSTLEQLLRTNAEIYVAQGTADDAVAFESFDVLRAELLAKGRDATYDVVVGGDHSFNIETNGQLTDGWTPVVQRVFTWFIGT